MEWNSKQFAHANDDGDGSKMDDVKVSAHVIGFGCPALLSQQLSLMTRDYVITVIADADVIPRMSGATLVNFLLDLWKFDYRDQAERDVEQALREVQNASQRLCLRNHRQRTNLLSVLMTMISKR